MVITKGNTAAAYQGTYPIRTIEQPVQKPGRRQVRRLRVGPMALYGTVLCIAVAIALFYLSQYALLAHMNLRIDSIQRQIETLERERRDLQRQVATLSSLDRIERIARDELGMVPSQDVRRLAVDNIICPEPEPEEDIASEKKGGQGLGAIIASWLEPKTASAESPDPEGL